VFFSASWKKRLLKNSGILQFSLTK